MIRYERNASIRRMAGLLGLAALLGGILLLVPRLQAEDGDPGSAPAARAVRLSFVQGEVHLYQGAQVLADQAVANTPLFEGARIETGNEGRAEIQFEDGSVARVSPQSSVTLSVLKGLSASSERNAEILLNSGLAYFELQGATDINHLRVRFGNSEVTASGFTVLRINADKAPGEVAVFSGNAHLEGGATPSLDLHGGQSVALNGNDPSTYNLAETIEPDSWDTWNSDRDQELTAAAANRTAATETQPDNQNPAWSDLDANGNWYNVPDQGYVWTPNEASNPDWDPYANGYWMNSPGYGYMWISGSPWGYLPYQCGAWNYYAFGWGWAPGSCNPWWGGGGGWLINIGYGPPRYRYPVRPRPRNPRPGGGREATPRPLIAVNRNVAPTPGSTMPAPRDKTGGTVMIAGHVLNPLRPIQQPRAPYNSGPVFNPRQGSSGSFQGGNSTPRAIGVPAHPGTGYNPAPQPRSGPTYTPPPSQPGGYFSRPAPPARSSPQPAPAPRSSPPPSAPSHPSGGGGGHVSGGGSVHSAGDGGGGHPSGSPHH